MNSKLDQFFSTESTALTLASLLGPEFNPRVVADFAVGSGSLLRVAGAFWPRAELLGYDRDDQHFPGLKEALPQVRLSKLDFLKTTTQSSRLRHARGRTDLVLLNPPFSCRGSSRIETKLQDASVHCSLAMAFVLRAVALLSPSGVISFVLPVSCISSTKDAEARDWLRRHGELHFVERLGNRAFPGCAASVVVGTFRAGTTSEARLDSEQQPALSISRGNAVIGKVKALRRGRTPLVHTTDITNGTLRTGLRKVSNSYRTFSGPLVLIPRVGRPDVRKICVYQDNNPIVPSDCIIVLECESPENANDTASWIRNNWPRIARLYVGTGAPYVTLSRLSKLLKKCPFRPRTVAISRPSVQIRDSRDAVESVATQSGTEKAQFGQSCLRCGS
jgi:predicted RNA methylase